MRRLVIPLLVLLPVLPAAADVLVTAEGLRLEGEVSRDAAGRYRVVTAEGETVLPASRVTLHREGPGARPALEARAEALDRDDVAGWFALALEAEAAGLPDLARASYERIVEVEPDHAAARRALGQEQLEGAWVDAAVARRARGLVLWGGRWMLPAEVEVAAQREVPPTLSGDAGALIRTIAGDDPVLRRAARRALADVEDARLVKAARGTLLDADPRVRATSARLLGEIGDEAALRPLIFSAARDLDADVRGEAVRAAMSFGHDDLAIPFLRALGSENPRLVGNAAEALAAIGDPRAVGYVVKRLSSHGSSTRNFVSFLNQVSYVRDYDVEIAQASNIANPDVATILEGVVLDVRVLDAAYTRTWVEPILVSAAGRLAGRSFADREEVLAWYAAAKEELPDFPRRASPPARRRGATIGAK